MPRPVAKRTANKTASKAQPRRRAVKARPRAVPAPPRGRRPAAATPDPPSAGTIDLAGGLRQFLTSIEVEVREVSALSERIDALVSELNELRDQQAKRLIVLDALRASVEDASLGTFLDKAIRPRKVRVPEIVPDRVAQA